MSFAMPAYPGYIWLALAVAIICTSWIASEISSLSKIFTKLEKRGMDIEYKMHVMQQSIDGIANTLESVESNTRP